MKHIKKWVEDQLNVSVGNIEVLHGGMSNYNYLVNTEIGKLLVRIPGENAELFVSREIERYHLDLVDGLGISNEILYFDTDSGYKITKYIDGEVVDYQNKSLSEISSLMRSYHNISSKYDYNPFSKSEKFESFSDNQSEDYFEIKGKLLQYKDYLEAQNKVFCHNDSQPANIINDDKLYLIDWEYAGNNDPVYDIVCYGEDYGVDTYDLTNRLLVEYFGELNNDLILRKNLWTVFQCIQWYNVALFKDNIGMSKKLNIDFKEVCDFFINKAKIKINEIEENNYELQN